jgi:hypothetical protein
MAEKHTPEERYSRRDDGMIIRKEQMEVLFLSAFPRQIQQWAREFRTELPLETQGYSDAQLHELLVSGSTASREYGLTGDFFTREYLSLILRAGAGVDGRPADPSIRAVLEDSASSPTEKMDRLAVLVPDRDAAEQKRIALAQAGSGRASPPASPQTDGEPDLPIDPRFLTVDKPEAVQEPDEME